MKLTSVLASALRDTEEGYSACSPFGEHRTEGCSLGSAGGLSQPGVAAERPGAAARGNEEVKTRPVANDSAWVVRLTYCRWADQEENGRSKHKHELQHDRDSAYTRMAQIGNVG